jgi:hypothetical protein
MGQESSEFIGEGERLRVREQDAWYDQRSELRRRYQRVREYCGVSLDHLINERKAQRYLCELWLLSCMVRNPEKAAKLPPGNPFRNR